MENRGVIVIAVCAALIVTPLMTAVLDDGEMLGDYGLMLTDSDGDGIEDSVDECANGTTGWTSDSDTDYDSDGCHDHGKWHWILEYEQESPNDVPSPGSQTGGWWYPDGDHDTTTIISDDGGVYSYGDWQTIVGGTEWITINGSVGGWSSNGQEAIVRFDPDGNYAWNVTIPSGIELGGVKHSESSVYIYGSTSTADDVTLGGITLDGGYDGISFVAELSVEDGSYLWAEGIRAQNGTTVGGDFYGWIDDVVDGVVIVRGYSHDDLIHFGDSLTMENDIGQCPSWIQSYDTKNTNYENCISVDFVAAVSMEDYDDDNDGVDDGSDSCSNGETGWASDTSNDWDSDGCQDSSEDSDDDDDGIADMLDSCPKSNPGAYVLPTGCEPDSDSDGVPESLDSCPTGVSNWTSDSVSDHDSDGCLDELWISGELYESEVYSVSSYVADWHVDGNGSSYYAGTFGGTMSLGSLSTTSSGSTDIFVAKKLSNGTRESRRFVRSLGR